MLITIVNERQDPTIAEVVRKLFSSERLLPYKKRGQISLSALNHGLAKEFQANLIQIIDQRLVEKNPLKNIEDAYYGRIYYVEKSMVYQNSLKV